MNMRPNEIDRTYVGRRVFLRAGIAATLAFGTLACAGAGTQDAAPPNILLITTDQQFADVMSCAGSPGSRRQPWMPLQETAFASRVPM